MAPESLQPIASFAPPPDLTHRHCVICGYALRGIDPEGHCPECGTPIERSLRGDALNAANPRWLGKMLAAVICLVVGDISSLVFGLPVIQRGAFTLPAPVRWTMFLVGLAAWVITIIGIVLFTLKEPAVDARRDPRRTRWFVRITVALVVLMAAAEIGSPFAVSGRSTMGVYLMFGMLPRMLGDLFGLLAEMGCLLLLRRLIRRTPAVAMYRIFGARRRTREVALYRALGVMLVVMPLSTIFGMLGTRVLQILMLMAAGGYYAAFRYPAMLWIDELGTLAVGITVLLTLPVLRRARREAKRR